MTPDYRLRARGRQHCVGFLVAAGQRSARWPICVACGSSRL